jgi:hypothetical protein
MAGDNVMSIGDGDFSIDDKLDRPRHKARIEDAITQAL